MCKRKRSIGHFGKYHNTLCLSPQILRKHCFQFLVGLTVVPRENKNHAYAKFGGTSEEYYGIFRNIYGLLSCLLKFKKLPWPYGSSLLENIFKSLECKAVCLPI